MADFTRRYDASGIVHLTYHRISDAYKYGIGAALCTYGHVVYTTGETTTGPITCMVCLAKDVWLDGGALDDV